MMTSKFKQSRFRLGLMAAIVLAAGTLLCADTANAKNIRRGFKAWAKGGDGNAALGNLTFVGGGIGNTASNDLATIVGGRDNTAIGFLSFVGGGEGNATSGDGSAVAGGIGNHALDFRSTIGGGQDNVASNAWTTVGGGLRNTASGLGATIPGGAHNIASGLSSFAAGNRAQANHAGAFVWADSTDANISSSGANQFIARASGGTAFFSDSGATVGVSLAPGGNSWSAISDRNVKENFKPVDTREVLEKVVAMPVTEWNLKSQEPSIRHIGPMAQDFKAAFGVGEDERYICGSDSDGVAFAAIQGLYLLLKEKENRVAELEKQLAEIKMMLTARPNER